MKDEVTGTYEVMYNDFGEVYVLAKDFSEAEELFKKSGFGGEFPNIKGIKLLARGISKYSFNETRP